MPLLRLNRCGVNCVAHYAIRLDPKYAKSYYSRGLAYEQMGETANADADFAQAKKLGYKTP